MTEVDVHVFSAISELLRQAIGLSDASVGRKTLDQAVQHRMQQVHVQDARTYLLMLQADPRELQHFIDEIVVSESWFFRELSPFECLRLFCRARLDEGCKKLRLLSAPCSRGEEPYSMAMTLLDMGLQPDQFEIIACDVSSGALEAAKRGLYRPLAFRERHETSERLTKRYFRDEGSERMLDASVRGTVIFRRENLAAVDFLGSESPFDVVFCRNLLIYLTEDARRIALNHLARLLTRDGLLYFGHSECRQGRQMGLVSWHPRFPAAFTNSSNATKKPFHESGAAERRQIDNPMSKLKIPDLPASLTTPIAQPSPTLGETPPAIRTTQPSLPHATEIGEEIAKARDLANRGLLQEAESCCQRLQTLHRFNPDVLCLLGVIKQASGQLSVAKQLFQQALFLAPDHREALTHLMLFSRIDGNDTQAANYQRRLERTPERDSLKP